MSLDKPEEIITNESSNKVLESPSEITPDSTSDEHAGNVSTSFKSSFPSAKDCRVLILGCGNSEVSEEMLSDGFSTITNVDISSVVIGQMREKYTDEWYKQLNTRLWRERKLDEGGHNTNESVNSAKSPGKNAETNKSSSTSDSPNNSKVKPKTRGSLSKTTNDRPLLMNKMLFECVDITKSLPFPGESYDLIVCKGTFDAVLCAANTLEKVKKMMNECHRVLNSQHGVMLIISYGEPANRLNCFDKSKWKEVKTYSVPKPLLPANVTNQQIGA